MRISLGINACYPHAAAEQFPHLRTYRRLSAGGVKCAAVRDGASRGFASWCSGKGMADDNFWIGLVFGKRNGDDNFMGMLIFALDSPYQIRYIRAAQTG